jgi:hypothetical protein
MTVYLILAIVAAAAGLGWAAFTLYGVMKRREDNRDV